MLGLSLVLASPSFMAILAAIVIVAASVVVVCESRERSVFLDNCGVWQC